MEHTPVEQRHPALASALKAEDIDHDKQVSYRGNRVYIDCVDHFQAQRIILAGEWEPSDYFKHPTKQCPVLEFYLIGAEL